MYGHNITPTNRKLWSPQRSLPSPLPNYRALCTRKKLHKKSVRQRQPSAADCYEDSMNTFIPRPPVERNVNTRQRSASMRGHPMHDTVPHRNDYQEDWNMPTIAGIGKRPNVMPESYNGTTSWTDYLIYFETCANVNGWTYADKGQYLVVCLRGQAQLVLSSLPGISRNDYLELCSALKTRFSPEHET